MQQTVESLFTLMFLSLENTRSFLFVVCALNELCDTDFCAEGSQLPPSPAVIKRARAPSSCLTETGSRCSRARLKLVILLFHSYSFLYLFILKYAADHPKRCWYLIITFHIIA